MPWIMIAWAVAAVWALWRRGWFARRGAGTSRDVRGVSAPAWFLGGLAVLIATSAGAAAGGVMAEEWFGRGGGALGHQAIATFVGYAVGVGLGVVVCRSARRAGGQVGRLWPGAGDWRRAGLGTLALFPIASAVGVLSAWASGWLGHPPEDELAHGLLRAIVDADERWAAAALGAMAVVGAPIVEEVVFRGMLQSAGLRVGLGRWGAIGLSSVAFALVHLPGGTVPAHALGPLLVLGVGLGAAYERSGSLGLVVLLHGAFNLVNLLLALGVSG